MLVYVVENIYSYIFLFFSLCSHILKEKVLLLVLHVCLKSYIIYYTYILFKFQFYLYITFVVGGSYARGQTAEFGGF